MSLLLPTKLKNLYSLLTEEQKNEVKRTGLGVTSQVLREGIELSRMLTDPSESQIQSTEDFLEKLYTQVAGLENIERVQRGDREVVTIAEPESGAAQVIRDIGSFAGTMVGLGKIAKPLQALKPVQKATQVAPKTVATTGFVARGETAAQLSLNPYQENFANILGDMIDDDSEGFASDLEKYMLEPIKSSQEKSELQNRLGLLAEGLIFTGAFGAVGAGIRNREAISKSFFNTLDSIKGQRPEVVDAFLNKIRRLKRQDKDFRSLALQKRQQAIVKGEQQLFPTRDYNLGDIDALDEKVLGLRKLSTIAPIRSLSNFIAKTNPFTPRGGRSELLHENYLKTQNAKEKWNATIDHVGRNLENAINDIHKAVGGNKEDVIENINKILFTDFRVPTTITSKGIRIGKTQQSAFDKELLKFPEKARKPIKKARNLQDQLSKLLLRIENIAPEDKKIIEEQLGFYVRESYRMFEDSGYTPSIQVYNTARRFVKSEIKRKNPDINDLQLRLQVQSEMDKLAGGRGQFANISSGFESFGKIKEGILVEKQEIPPAIKAYLGEITDPTDKLLLSMKKIAQFVEDSNFHNQAFRDGKDIYFHKKNNVPGFTAQIPMYEGVKVQPFGNLSGYYTTPQLAEYYTKRYQQGGSKVIESLPPFLKEFWQSLLFLKSQSQKSATTRRITTHIKNIVGGGQITGANGFKLLNPKTISESFKTVYSQLTRTSNIEQQQFIEELAGQGVLNKNAIINDLKNMSKDASNISFFGAKPLQYLESLAKKTPGVKKLLKGDEKVTELYIAEDDFWKINMYLNEKKHLDTFNKALPQGPNAIRFDKFRYDTPEKLQNEAGRLTRNGLPNYDLVPDNLKELRTIPFIGTFFSFLSESMRLAGTIPRQINNEFKIARELKDMGANEASKIMKSRAMDRATGFTTFGIGGSAAATSIANLAIGTGADVIDNIKPFLPEWMQNDNIVYTVNEEGVPIVYNITPWDAFDFPRKPIQNFVHKTVNKDLTEEELKQYDNELLTEMLTPFFGESLTQETLNAYIFRDGVTADGRLLKNPFNRLEVYDPDREGERLNPTNLKIIAMNLVETLEPGTVTDTRKYFRDKFGKEMTSLDQKIYREEAMFKWLTGFGGIPFNKEYVENIYSFKINDFKNDKDKANTQIYRAITDEMTKEKFLDNYLNANREYYKSYKKLHTLTEAAENLELNTLQILKDNGVSESDRYSFLGGNRYFKPLSITEPMQKRILESPSLQKEYIDILLEVDKLSRTLNQLPVLVDPENEKEITIPLSDEVNEIFKDLRLPKSTGGLVSGPEVSDTKENPADRVDPFTGAPYSDQMARLGFNRGSIVDIQKVGNKSVRTYEDGSTEEIEIPEEIRNEPGLRMVAPIIELLGGVGILKGGKVVKEVGEEVLEKRAVPKILYHGSGERGLKEIIPSYRRTKTPNPALQRGVFTNPSIDNVVKFTGEKGSVYGLDVSDISSFKNLLSISKNKVLNADKPNKSLLKALDKEIKDFKTTKKTGLLQQGEISKSKQLQQFKDDMLNKDNYITGITPAVDDFLRRQKVDVVKTTPNFRNPDKVPNFILLRDSVPVKDEFLTKLQNNKYYIQKD